MTLQCRDTSIYIHYIYTQTYIYTHSIYIHISYSYLLFSLGYLFGQSI